MPQPSARRIYLQPSTKEEVEVLHSGTAEETTPHMLQGSQLAHPCSLDNVIMFNDVGKQCAELWTKMV